MSDQRLYRHENATVALDRDVRRLVPATAAHVDQDDAGAAETGVEAGVGFETDDADGGLGGALDARSCR